MAKTEWGMKRICTQCGARFYDMGAASIVCPSCGADYNQDARLRVRRSRSGAAEEPAPRVAKPADSETTTDNAVEEESDDLSLEDVRKSEENENPEEDEAKLEEDEGRIGADVTEEDFEEEKESEFEDYESDLGVGVER